MRLSKKSFHESEEIEHLDLVIRVHIDVDVRVTLF
jgi:hypothetical protein